MSIGTSAESRKSSKDPGKYGTEFGMQMIAGRLETAGINRLGNLLEYNGLQHSLEMQ